MKEKLLVSGISDVDCTWRRMSTGRSMAKDKVTREEDRNIVDSIYKGYMLHTQYPWQCCGGVGVQSP